MIDLDERLRDYHRVLVDGFVEEAAGIRPRVVPEPRPHRRRRLAFGAAAAAMLTVAAALIAVRLLPSAGRHTVTLRVPGFTIVAEAATGATPHLSRAAAEGVAYAELARSPQQLNVSGFRVTTATFAAAVVSVNQTCGAHIGMSRPRNVWVVALQAPPQGQWQFIRAAVLVDDDTGSVAGGQVLTGRTPAGSLATCHWGT